MKKGYKRLQVLLLLGTLMGGSLFPTPAHAVYSVQDAKLQLELALQQATLYADYVMQWLGIKKVVVEMAILTAQFLEGSEATTQAEVTSGLSSMAGAKTSTALKIKLAQAEVDGVLKDAEMALRVKAKIKNIPSDNTQLASSIYALMGVGVTENFYQTVSTYALNAVENMFRGKGDDGNGPAYTHTVLATRCQFGLAEKIDGANQDCISPKTGTDGRPLAGADQTSSTLDGIQTLEFPVLKASADGQGKTPDPQNTDQEFWNAGLYYCLNIAGSRPTPPVKDQLLTVGGKEKRPVWNHCAAIQSAIVRSCTNLLALYTRPNAEDFPDLVAMQNDIRSALIDMGIEEPWEEGKGASLHTMMTAFHAACKSGSYAAGQAQDGAGAADVMKTIDKCTQAWTNFEQLTQEMRYSLLTGTEALGKIDQCWDQAR